MSAASIVDLVVEPDIDAGDVRRLWAASGCQAVTAPGVLVPARLMAGTRALISGLDAAGAGLAIDFMGDGVGVLAERAASLMLRRADRTSCGGATRLVRAADAWIAITLARRDDRLALPAWIGVDPAAPLVVTDASPWAEVERRVSSRGAVELVELATLLGLACAVVGEARDVRPPVLAERFGATKHGDLQGLRVLNLGSLWASPLCADVLRRCGADVVCVESTGRPDGARATSGWFDAIHVGQRSVALDFRSEFGVELLSKLIDAADVVIEGSRPRALAQFGIDARQRVASGSVDVWVSITGYGRSAGDGNRVGFGDDAAAAGGLVGWLGEQPVLIADAVADPLTGLIAAAAVIDEIVAGRRSFVDVALSGVAAVLASRGDEQVVEPLADPASPRPRPPVSQRFELGVDTLRVLRDWKVVD